MRRDERLPGLTLPAQRVRVGLATRIDHHWLLFLNEGQLCLACHGCRFDIHAAHTTRARRGEDRAESDEAGHDRRGPDDRDTRRVTGQRRDEEYHGTE